MQGEALGFAMLTFGSKEEATAAVMELSSTSIKGHTVAVILEIR